MQENKSFTLFPQQNGGASDNRDRNVNWDDKGVFFGKIFAQYAVGRDRGQELVLFDD